MTAKQGSTSKPAPHAGPVTTKDDAPHEQARVASHPVHKPDTDPKEAGKVTPEVADEASARHKPGEPTGGETSKVQSTGQMLPGCAADENPLPPTNPPPQVPAGSMQSSAVEQPPAPKV